jgi:hypothetical protein
MKFDYGWLLVGPFLIAYLWECGMPTRGALSFLALCGAGILAAEFAPKIYRRFNR